MSSKRAVRRRGCKGKRRYTTWVAACEGVSLMRRRGATGPLNAYGCNFCGGFHLGHTPFKVRQAIAARRGAA